MFGSERGHIVTITTKKPYDTKKILEVGCRGASSTAIGARFSTPARIRGIAIATAISSSVFSTRAKTGNSLISVTISRTVASS